MAGPRISLEQWRALLAVVDAGGYARAARALNKSQSTVSYAVHRIESLLGVKAFELEGRRAMLTPIGHMLVRRARALVGEAGDFERAVQRTSAGWEAEVGVAMEILFPPALLIRALARFGEESPHTRIEVMESVLGGTTEALLTGQADLALTPHVPTGFLGRPLMRLRLVAVAHPQHPLHALDREITARDLRTHRHLTVRDTGTTRGRGATFVEVERRWTVSDIATSISAVRAGHGFAWLPEVRIWEDLDADRLRPLPLQEGGERFVELYLVLADPEFAGPGVCRLADIIGETVHTESLGGMP